MSQTWIVVPCFNEAARLDRSRFLRFCAEQPRYQLLFVNDGSADQTGPMLDAIRASNPRSISVLHLAKNQGKGEAVRQGMLEAFEMGADAAGYWDADLAAPIEFAPQFQEILDRRPDTHVVLGARLRLLGRAIDRHWLRGTLGRIFAGCASRVLGLPIHDTQCGAKMLRNTEETRQLFVEPFSSRWIFDVELLMRWRIAGGVADPGEGLYELPIDAWRDVKGSKLKSTDFLRAFGDLWTIHRKYGRRLPAPIASQSPESRPAALSTRRVPRPMTTDHDRIYAEW